MLLYEKRVEGLTDDVYKQLHSLLETITDTKSFLDLFRYIHKVAKYIDKREELAVSMFNLLKDIRENSKNSKYQICSKLVEANDEAGIEERVLFELHYMHYLLGNNNAASQVRVTADEYSKIAEILRSKPYTKVL